MKTHWIPALALFFLSAAFAAADSSVQPGGSITGRYVLVEHVKGVDAFDGIDFHPDKTCTVDYDGSNGIGGSYEINKDGTLSITMIDGDQLTYHFRRMKITLLLSQYGKDDLNYDLVPDPPSKLAFQDVLGAYLLRTAQWDGITEITAGHTFRAHIHTYNQDGTYTDMNFSGKCTYDNGVITYLPDDSTDILQRDVVIRHDAKSLWVIDPYNDDVRCEAPAKNLDLPPPPPQYSKPASQ